MTGSKGTEFRGYIVQEYHGMQDDILAWKPLRELKALISL
jgi:hypothetical protein